MTANDIIVFIISFLPKLLKSVIHCIHQYISFCEYTIPAALSFNSCTTTVCEELMLPYFLSAVWPSSPVSLLMTQLRPILVSTLLNLVFGNTVSDRSVHGQLYWWWFLRQHLGGSEIIRIVQMENLNWDEIPTVATVIRTRELKSWDGTSELSRIGARRQMSVPLHWLIIRCGAVTGTRSITVWVRQLHLVKKQTKNPQKVLTTAIYSEHSYKVE